MVKLSGRQKLKDIIINETSGEDYPDIVLKKMSDELFVVDHFYYAGNISSILFAPLLDLALEKFDLDIYSNDIYLYAFDNVLNIPDCIYLAISRNNAYRQVDGTTLFNILKQVCMRYYYDEENIVFVYKVPDKYVSDYRKIIISSYTEVSPGYKKLCSPTGLAYAILTNNSLVKEQWQKVEEFLGEVVERNELTFEKSKHPVRIVTDTRNFPIFTFERETYLSCALDKSGR